VSWFDIHAVRTSSIDLASRGRQLGPVPECKHKRFLFGSSTEMNLTFWYRKPSVPNGPSEWCQFRVGLASRFAAGSGAGRLRANTLYPIWSLLPPERA